MWKSAKVRAKKYGIPFAIGLADIVIPRHCPILGIPISVTDKRVSGHSPSLDRINPAKGYIPGNVAVISYRANTIKSDGTAAEHQAVAKYMRRSGVE